MADVRLERRGIAGGAGGGHALWLTFGEDRELNVLTASMLERLAGAVRGANDDREAACIVLTGEGTRAFSAGAQAHDRRHLRLVQELVSALLGCEKPVICRVNGLRGGDAQEIGMACDFSVAQDLALFRWAGPGDAPPACASDLLQLFVGMQEATAAAVLGEEWNAHRALRLGLLTEAVPALRVDGEFVPNPLVETSRWVDARGRAVYGEPKEGAALAHGRALRDRGIIDLSELDAAVERLATRLVQAPAGRLAVALEPLRARKRAATSRTRVA